MKIIYFFFFILLVPGALGFGVSPAKIEANLKNSETIEKEFFILNNNHQDKIFNISSEFQFLNFSSFIVNVDSNNEKEIKFLINIPYDVPSGEYEGRIYAREVLEDLNNLNLDPLLGVKVILDVDSNYLEKEVKVNSEEILNSEQKNMEFTKLVNPENIFYILIALVLILTCYRIFVNLKK